MPLYDYECQSCGHIQEELRSMNERENKAFCNDCQTYASVPILSGHITLHKKESHIPKSNIEKLTGANVKGPGLNKKAKASFLSGCKHNH